MLGTYRCVMQQLLSKNFDNTFRIKYILNYGHPSSCFVQESCFTNVSGHEGTAADDNFCRTLSRNCCVAAAVHLLDWMIGYDRSQALNHVENFLLSFLFRNHLCSIDMNPRNLCQSMVMISTVRMGISAIQSRR